MAKHSQGKHAAPAKTKSAAEKPLGKGKAAPASSKAAAKAEPSAAPAKKHAAPAPAPSQAFDAAAFDMQPAKGGRSVAKKVGIVAGVLLGLVLAAYLAGAGLFSLRYFPNTHIAGIDLSLKTPEEACEELEGALAEYHFKVVGQGLDLDYSAAAMGVAFDSAAIADTVKGDMNVWLWPLEISRTHENARVTDASLMTEQLAASLTEAAAAFNENASLPENAKTAFDDEQNKFAVIPEVQGTMIDPERLLKVVSEGMGHLEPKINLNEAVLVPPSILRDEPTLALAAEEANKLLTCDFDLIMDGHLVAEVNPKKMSEWVAIDESMQVSFSEEAFAAWVDALDAGCNTVGGTRTYTRDDGKEITVSGGAYGWAVDSEALRTLVNDGVRNGATGEIEIPVLQSGSGYAEVGGRDWGNRFMDVDLSEQYARFYDESATLIWESAIVTGAPGRNTPEGVYYITTKGSPVTLVGEPLPGEKEPEYRTKVQYWMPFVGNAIGFHDATWQYAFGGTRWCDGFGSHGCVNLPYGAAEWLYSIIEIGDVVSVHW